MPYTKKITNTGNYPKPQWLGGGNPTAIEKQESEGQEEMVNSMQLPIKCNNIDMSNATGFYQEIGIKIFSVSESDNLFVDVILPEGWKKIVTDHSMWSDLVDNKWRKRASIFYKAAFYDRDAFINIFPRYKVSNLFVSDNYEDGNYYAVIDNSNNEILFKTAMVYKDCSNDKILASSAKQWLQDHFPLWKNLSDYWD